MSADKPSQILYVNFFPRFVPPKSGGELRYFYLTHALARDRDVAAINCTFPEAALEQIEHSDGVFETRVPKPRWAVWLHRLFDRVTKFRECSGLVVAMSSRGDGAFRQEFRRMAAGARAVVVAAPFIYPAVRDLIRRDQYLIYDSYNVEYLLHQKTLPGELGEILNRRYIRRWERRLARDAHMIWTCSREDAAQMERLYGADPLKMHVIPNGIDVDEIVPARGEAERAAARGALNLPHDRPVFIYLGSLFNPNIESAEFIARTLAPQFPEAMFCIAGKVCEHFRGGAAGNMRLMGLISEEDKARLYSACTAALNPVFSGSGTSLKVLEFFCGRRAGDFDAAGSARAGRRGGAACADRRGGAVSGDDARGGGDGHRRAEDRRRGAGTRGRAIQLGGDRAARGGSCEIEDRAAHHYPE